MSWLKVGDVVAPTHPNKAYKKVLYRGAEEVEVVRTCARAFYFPLPLGGHGTCMSNMVKRVSRGPATSVEGAELDDGGA